jgi:hypothetical protein
MKKEGRLLYFNVCMTNGDYINNSYILVDRLCAFSVIILLYPLTTIRHREGHNFTPSPGLNFGTEKLKPTFRIRVFTLPLIHTSLVDSN